MAVGNVDVTLVHGTRARGAPWTLPGSSIWVGLENAGMTCATFRWTGRNSHGARKRAAIELATQLRRNLAAKQGSVQGVVAHSHGGNVAAHAVWRLLSEGERSRVAVVTLATPFFFAHRRRIEPAVVFAATVAVVVVLALSPLAAWAFFGSDEWTASRIGLGMVVLVLAPPALVQVVSWLVWMRGHGSLARDKDQEEFIDSVQVPSCENGRLLVVRAPDDEAGSGLALVQFGSLVTTRLIAVARPARWRLAVSVLFLGTATLSLVVGDEWSDTAVFLVSSLVAGGMLTVSAFISLPILLSLLHGIDGPAAWFFANVTAEATPPGKHMVIQRDIGAWTAPRTPLSGWARVRSMLFPSAPLSHSSLYTDPQVIDAVIAHFEAQTNV